MTQGAPAAPGLSAQAAPPMPAAQPGLFALCAVVFKLRIGFAIALSALGGAVLAAGQWPALIDTAVLVVSVLLASSGAGGFNHWFDRDIDALMGRTRSRPFANGQLEPSRLWPLAFFLMIALGTLLGVWWFNWASGLFVLAGALTYVLIYTVWLKRRTHWNIVIGGAAGSWAVFAGAAAEGAAFAPAVLLLAAVLFLWTPSHFWSLATAVADDYRRAGVPMLPVTHGRTAALRWNLLNTLVLVACTVLLAAVVNKPVLWLGVLAGSGWLLWTTWAMVRDPQPKIATRAFRASLLQLGALLVALFAVFLIP